MAKKRVRVKDKTMRNLVVVLLVLSVIVSIGGTWIVLEESYSMKTESYKVMRANTVGRASVGITAINRQRDLVKNANGKVSVSVKQKGGN